MKMEKVQKAITRFNREKRVKANNEREEELGRRKNGEVSEKIVTNDQENSKKFVKEDYEINTKGGPPAKKLRRFWENIK